jgi:hypothetical protein
VIDRWVVFGIIEVDCGFVYERIDVCIEGGSN